MSTTTEDIGSEVQNDIDKKSLDFEFNGSVTTVSGLRIFDVGQGDCIGLLDQNGEVFCYVDYGGKNDHPDNHDPDNTKSRLPNDYANDKAIVILTHWDCDHFWSAYKKNTEAKDCAWLVPRQMASPTAVRFAAGLSNARCWPESRDDQLYGYPVGDCELQIRKCAKFNDQRPREDRNLSGIAVTIKKIKEDGQELYLVLPGDCPFQDIPHFPSDGIIGLVAFHHGASRHWNSDTTDCITNSYQGNRVAYSFSSGNSYGHPDRSNYDNALWSNGVETPSLRSINKEYEDITW